MELWISAPPSGVEPIQGLESRTSRPAPTDAPAHGRSCTHAQRKLPDFAAIQKHKIIEFMDRDAVLGALVVARVWFDAVEAIMTNRIGDRKLYLMLLLTNKAAARLPHGTYTREIVFSVLEIRCVLYKEYVIRLRSPRMAAKSFFYQ